MRNSKFTNGLIIGGIIGATIGMMNKDQTYRWRRKIMRAGRNAVRRNGLIDAITDLF